MVGALGISGTGVMADLPLIVAFVILAAFTYSSGLRAPASIAIVKDILIYITAFAAVIVIPVQLGGFERFLPVGRIVVDEFAVDVARVEIGGGDRHDCGRHQRADADRGKCDSYEPGRKAVQEERRHGEIVAELLEACGVFGKAGDARGNGEEANQCEQTEHQGIARQQRGIAAHGVRAARGEYSGH